MLFNLLFSKIFMHIVIFGLVFISVSVLIYYLFPNEKEALAKKRLGVLEESFEVKQTGLLKTLKPLYTTATPLLYSNSAPTFWLNYLEKQKEPLNQKLIAAHLREEITPDEVMGLKCVMAFLFMMFGGYLYANLIGPLPMVMVMGLFILGYLFPNLWINERLKSYRSQINAHLPYTIDLLTLSVESGLDFTSAIKRLTSRSKPNVLLDEFGWLLREIRLGSTRAEALRSMSKRLHIEEISSLNTLLIQADQLGTPIGNVLRAQSEQLRVSRFQKAEIAGAKASQMILFPLVFCILPAAILILLGPTLIGFLQGGFF